VDEDSNSISEVIDGYRLSGPSRDNGCIMRSR